MRTKFIGLVLMVVVLLTGCVDSESAQVLNELNSLQGVNTGFAEGQSLSFTERQALLYKRLRNHQLLKLTGLASCSQAEIDACLDLIDVVDMQLCGQLRGEDTKVSEDVIDYMMMNFEQTPYYWQRASVSVLGKDTSADYIIVDVTYRTIGYTKDVVPDSSIILGEPNYDTLLKNRMNRALEIFEIRYNNPDDERLPELEQKFVDAYGTFDEVYEEQNNWSPSEYVYLFGNQKTTSGVASTTDTSGTMTYRFVLNPKFVYGINMGMECQHMYMLSYNLSEETSGTSASIMDMAGYNTLANVVYDLVKSYFTCVDESNYDGLYKLVNDFGTFDKYYQDYFEYSYKNHANFRVDISSIEGTTVKGRVVISAGERPKDTKMTLPLYTDTYSFEINLYGEDLKFTDIHLVNRTIDGEPAIEVKLGEDTGFSYEVSLSNKDKSQIEDIICKLGVVQLKGLDTSDDFVSLVDLAISEADMVALRQNVFKLSGDHKVVWLQSYIQGNSNYALVQCKEQFSTEDGVFEFVTRYEFTLRGALWALTSYNVTSAVKLSITELNTIGALCVCSPTEVETYTTQATDNEEEVEQEHTEIFTKDYAEYKPSIIRHSSLDPNAEAIYDEIVIGDDDEIIIGDDENGESSGSGESTDTEPVVRTYTIDTINSTPEYVLTAFCDGYFENYLIQYTSSFANENFQNYVNGLKGKNWVAKFYDVDALSALTEEKDMKKDWSSFVKLINEFWSKAFTSDMTFDICDSYIEDFTKQYNKFKENGIDLFDYIVIGKEKEESDNENNGD